MKGEYLWSFLQMIYHNWINIALLVITSCFPRWSSLLPLPIQVTLKNWRKKEVGQLTPEMNPKGDELWEGAVWNRNIMSSE